MPPICYAAPCRQRCDTYATIPTWRWLSAQRSMAGAAGGRDWRCRCGRWAAGDACRAGGAEGAWVSTAPLHEWRGPGAREPGGDVACGHPVQAAQRRIFLPPSHLLLSSGSAGAPALSRRRLQRRQAGGGGKGQAALCLPQGCTRPTRRGAARKGRARHEREGERLHLFPCCVCRAGSIPVCSCTNRGALAVRPELWQLLQASSWAALGGSLTPRLPGACQLARGGALPGARSSPPSGCASGGPGRARGDSKPGGRQPRRPPAAQVSKSTI